MVEITVEIGDNLTVVEAELNGTEMKFTLNATDRDVILEEIAARMGLSPEVVRNVTKFKEHLGLEVEVEFENGASRIKMRLKDMETEFLLNTTNRDIIIEEVAAKTGYTIEQVKGVIEFEPEFKRKIREINFPVKKRVILYQLREHLIGMDAVIEFAGELGENTTELWELRTGFKAVIGSIENVSSSREEDSLWGQVAEARRLAEKFRVRSNELLGDRVEEAREHVAEMIAEDREGVLRREADRVRVAEGTHSILSFDAYVENAQRKIDRLLRAGFDVREAQETLDEIRRKRPLLLNATEAFINSCLGKPLSCRNAEHENLRELKEEIRREFKLLDGIIKKNRQIERIAHLAAKLEHAVEKAGDTLRDAEARGLDVTVYRVKLYEIKKILDNAESKAEAGDLKGAIEDIRYGHGALTHALRELAEELRGEKGGRGG